MERAAVPEASVNEYCNSGLRKDNIGSASNAWHDRDVDTEAQTECVQVPSQCYLCGGVTLAR